jgi:hypothetical protein
MERRAARGNVLTVRARTPIDKGNDATNPALVETSYDAQLVQIRDSSYSRKELAHNDS